MLNSPTSAAYCTLFFLSPLTLLDFLLLLHMKSLIYETPVESEKDLQARGGTAADVGLSGIGDLFTRPM